MHRAECVGTSFRVTDSNTASWATAVRHQRHCTDQQAVQRHHKVERAPDDTATSCRGVRPPPDRSQSVSLSGQPHPLRPIRVRLTSHTVGSGALVVR